MAVVPPDAVVSDPAERLDQGLWGGRLLTVQELADWLNVSRSTFHRIQHGDNPPPGFRLGGQMRYRPEEVNAWLEKLPRSQAPNPVPGKHP